MSDTPRTDALIATFKTEGNEFAWLEDLKDLCRELERGQSARPEALRREPVGWVVAVEEDGWMRVYGPQYRTRWSAEQDAALPMARGQKAEVWECFAVSPLAQRQEKP